MKSSYIQKLRLLILAWRISFRSRPLGIGLKNQCWGGLAAEIASNKSEKVTDYYGITFSQYKHMINKNNRTNSSFRNFRMTLESIRLAIANC